MTLFSYVVARDFGFAPNPFFGTCSLATCKPLIRKKAVVDDWIIGTGSAGRNISGRVVFAMRVEESLSFDSYWNDPRFVVKRPNLQGSRKYAYGDNIYSRDGSGNWHQADSHHSYKGGKPNRHNLLHDTQTDRVLLGSDFAYWGGSGPSIPTVFRDYDGYDVCAIRGHKCKFPESLVEELVGWYRSLDARGFLGAPTEWRLS